MPSKMNTAMMSEPMNFTKLKEMERENRKNLIITAAERVFTELPFDQVTIRNIAKQAGITATAIYRYFPDKQALYAEAYIRSNNRLLERIVHVIKSRQDLCLEEITMLIIDHFMNEEQNLKMRAHFLIDDSLSDEQSGSLSESARAFLNVLENHFQQFNPNLDLRLFSRTYIAALNGLLLTFRKYPSKNRKDHIKNLKTAGSMLAGMFQAQIIPPS